MDSRQQSFEPDYRPPSRQKLEIADFLGVLPPKVMPTYVRVLERDGNVLLVRYYAYGQLIPRSQDRIWKLLTRDNPDAPGNVTVFCIWGVQATGRSRALKVYDWTGETEVMPRDNDAIRAAISKWWVDARRP